MSEYVWPCPNYTMVSSPFGYRNGIFTPGAEFHKGVDLAAATGAPILATKAGTVLTAGWSDSFGNWIHLDTAMQTACWYRQVKPSAQDKK